MVHLAFVLLKKSLLKRAKLPDPGELVGLLTKRVPGKSFHLQPPDDPNLKHEGHSVAFDGGRVIVGLVPAAVPEGEADGGFQFSIASWSSSFRVPQHDAHLLVTLQLENDLPPLEAQRFFTAAVAAVLEASKGVAVYWGQAGVSHPTSFFLDVANGDPDMWIMLWTGVSRANVGPNRVSLLSLGMSQFGVMDLMVNGPAAMGQDLIMSFFQLLDYAVKRGEAIPDGDTVGSSESERLQVRYEPSPIDPQASIWRVDY